MLLCELDEIRLLAEAEDGSVPAAGGVVLAGEEGIGVGEVGLRFRGDVSGEVEFALCGFGYVWCGIGF